VFLEGRPRPSRRRSKAPSPHSTVRVRSRASHLVGGGAGRASLLLGLRPRVTRFVALLVFLEGPTRPSRRRSKAPPPHSTVRVRSRASHLVGGGAGRASKLLDLRSRVSWFVAEGGEVDCLALASVRASS